MDTWSLDPLSELHSVQRRHWTPWNPHDPSGALIRTPLNDALNDALGVLLCFSQKLDLGASASVAKSLFHWLRGRFMMLKRMLRIQFL